MTALARPSSNCKPSDTSSRQRERPTSTNPQLSDSNKDLVVSPRWVLYSKTDRPTDSRSYYNFDFDFWLLNFDFPNPAWRRVRIPPPYPWESQKATKREPSAWGFNWATLFLGVINMGTWPSRLGESRFWGSKIWSRVPRDSDPRMNARAKTSSNCKRQTCFLVRESFPHRQTRNCLIVIKIWS
jgi:hypothetical protein